MVDDFMIFFSQTSEESGMRLTSQGNQFTYG